MAVALAIAVALSFCCPEELPYLRDIEKLTKCEIEGKIERPFRVNRELCDKQSMQSQLSMMLHHGNP